MKTLLLPLLASILVCEASQAAHLGDPAAPLKIQEIIKGDPVDLAAGKGKRIFVVEFWATWCGPCKVSIPHLTELQRKFKDNDVTFIGISDETPGKVKSFVDRMGGKMNYVVAIDSERKTSEAYMKAYGQNGIPTAFIVDKEGRIAWVGHPMGGLEEALAKIIEGKYDLAGARKEADGREEKQRRMVSLSQSFSKFIEQSEAGDAAAALTGERLLTDVGGDAMILNAISWNILTKPDMKHRDLKFALKASDAAVKASAGKDAAILSINARALADNGRLSDAIVQQKKAIEAGSSDMKADLEKSLKGYEEKAAAK